MFPIAKIVKICCINIIQITEKNTQFTEKRKSQLNIITDYYNFLRSLPDSNWSKRFCRPVPNHSVKRPLV